METRESLEREIADTTQSLMGKVETVTESVKQTAQSLTLTHQMKTRPATVVAASIAAGLFAGLKMGSRRTVGRSLLRALAPSLVSQAVSLVAPIAVGVGVNVVGDWARKKYPQSGALVDSLQGALGAPRPPQAALEKPAPSPLS